MSRLSCFTLFVFMLTVWAEHEDFQAYHIKQTEGTTVTMKRLLKEENLTGPGTAELPTESAYQHTAVAARGTSPGTTMLHTTTPPPYGRTQITEASAVIASRNGDGFVSSNGSDSLTVTKDNLLGLRSQPEPELPLTSNYEKVVFTSTQATFESIMNSTSEPEVHSSAGTVKASVWLHPLGDNGNQRNADYATSDGWLRVPMLSTPHPPVIDYLAELRYNDEDKRPDSKNEKGVLESEGQDYPFGTMESIFQSDRAEGLVTRTSMKNLCLTCLKDRRTASTEKTEALPMLLIPGSSHTLNMGGLTLDFNQPIPSLPTLIQQSTEKRKEVKNKDIPFGAKHPIFSVKDLKRQDYNLTYLFSDKKRNHSQTILNETLVTNFPSDKGTFELDTNTISELSSKSTSRHTYLSESFVTERPVSITRVLYHFAKSFHTVSKPLKHSEPAMFEETVSSRDPQLKLTYFSKNKLNDANSFSANFQNVFPQNRTSDFNNGPASDMPISFSSTGSGKKNVIPECTDHNDKSQPTMRMQSIAAPTATTSFHLKSPTTSAFNDHLSRSLAGRATSLMSLLSGIGQLSAKTSSQPTGSGTQPASINTIRHQTVNSLLKKSVSSFDLFQSMKLPVKHQRDQSFTGGKGVEPIKPLVSELRQTFGGDDVSMLMLTTPSKKLFSERLTINRLLDFHKTSQGKSIQERTYDDAADNSLGPAHQTLMHYNGDVIRESGIVSSLNLGDNDEQELTPVTGDEETETAKKEGDECEEAKGELEEIQKEEERERHTREDERLETETEREESLGSRGTEVGKREKANSTEEEMNEDTAREDDRTEEDTAKTRREEEKDRRRTTGEEDTTVKHESRPGGETELRSNTDARREVEYKINEEKSGEDRDNIREEVDEEESRMAKQREVLTEEVAQTTRQETISRGGMTSVREDKTDATMQARHSVLRGLTTNSKGLNGDERHAVTETFFSLSLTKQLGAEHKVTRLKENIPQITEIKHHSFSREVTTKHRPLQTFITQSQKLSRPVSPDKEPYTGIKPHLSPHKAMSTGHAITSKLKKQSTPHKVEATFTTTAVPKMLPKVSQSSYRIGTPTFRGKLKPSTSPHGTATIKSTLSVLNSAGKLYSFTTPQLAITDGLPSARTHSTGNTNTLNTSIIHSVSDQMHTFRSSTSEENSRSKTTTVPSPGEQIEHVIPAHVSGSTAEDPFTSDITKEVDISSALDLILYGDSFHGAPIEEALSSEGQVTVDLSLLPHQGQSVPEMTDSSSSSNVSPGQPCSVTRSGGKAQSDGLCAPPDNELSLAVAEATTEQSPVSSMPPQPLLILFGGDSSPGTNKQEELSRSISEEIILRMEGSPHSNFERSNNESDNAGTPDEKTQTEKIAFSMETYTVKDRGSDAKNSLILIAQTTSKPDHVTNKTNEFNSLSVIQTEGGNHAVKTTDDSDVPTVGTTDGKTNAAKITHQDNHVLSSSEAHNETRNGSTVFTVQAAEQAIHDQSVPLKSDITTSVFDTNESVSRSKIQTTDGTNNTVLDIEIIAVQTTDEKQHGAPTSQTIEGSATKTFFGNDYKDRDVSEPEDSREAKEKILPLIEQQIAEEMVTVFSEFQETAEKINHYVSLAGTTSIGDFIVSKKPREVAVTAADVNIAGQSLHMVRSNNPVESSSLSETRLPPVTGKIVSTVKKKTRTEIQSTNKNDHENSIQTNNQTQHDLAGMITIAHVTNGPDQSNQGDMSVITTYRPGEAPDAADTNGIGAEHPSLEETTPSRTTSISNRVMPGRTSAVPDRTDSHGKHASSEKTSTMPMALGVLTDRVMPTRISSGEVTNGTDGLSKETVSTEPTGCSRTSCAASDETTTTTTQAPNKPGKIENAVLEDIAETLAGDGTDPVDVLPARVTSKHVAFRGTTSSQVRDNLDRAMSENTATQTTSHDHTVARKVMLEATSKTDFTNSIIFGDPTKRKNNKEADETSTETYRRAETGRSVPQESSRQAQSVDKTARQGDLPRFSEAQASNATKATLSEETLNAITAHTTEKTIVHTAFEETKTKTRSNSETTDAATLEAENATRSEPALSGRETPVQDFGQRLSLLEPESGSDLLKLKHRRRASPDLYLSGVTEVSDDLCGSGNYTAEMSLNLERGVQPGDLVPALGNLRVVINLKTNNSLVNLEVTSCCLSPNVQPDLTNSTCCLFSRLSVKPVGIRLLPSVLSTSASFTISLFQMINYSVVYLHCDLSICLRNRSDCETQCLQQRSAFPLEGPEAIVTNLRNRISFGPMLKKAENSTFPEEIDPSGLDLVLVILSLAAGSSIVTVTLLLVWLAYRHRADWLVQSVAPLQACCGGAGCLRRGGDLILP